MKEEQCPTSQPSRPAGRLRLLAERGVTVASNSTPGDPALGAVPPGPAGWPPDFVAEAWTLIERVLDRWRHDVEDQGRRFVVTRVPSEEQLGVPLAEQHTWAPRCMTTARAGTSRSSTPRRFCSRASAQANRPTTITSRWQGTAPSPTRS